ncbi:MAG: hypothetical protein U0R19_32010 [Bryobacteraceae bacterium]
MLPWVCLLATLIFAPHLHGHAPPIPTPKAPFTVRSANLLDADRNRFLLNGVALPFELANRQIFRILRQRWNLNAVRLTIPAETPLETIRATVQLANEEALVPILASSPSFLTTVAAVLKDNPMVVFSLYSPPDPERPQPEDWPAWRETTQPLVNAIRATGAQQIISIPSFREKLGFQGFTQADEIQGENLIYEAYAFFDQATTDEERDAAFGFLTARHPVYVGGFGAPLNSPTSACQVLPRDNTQLSEALQRLLLYLLIKQLSWTAAEFRPGDLITNPTTADASTLEGEWACAPLESAQPGIGQLLLLYQTGDPHGFGSLAPDQIASAAGGPASPLVPGQLLSIYGQGLGPDTETTDSAETQVTIDNKPVPIFSASYFQLKIQVPYEVLGQSEVTLQATYRGVPSNALRMPVQESAPEIFLRPATVNEAAAFDSAGRPNSQTNPFAPSDLVVLYATGLGQTTPASQTGQPATAPLPVPTLPISLTISGQPATIEYISQAPGQVGVTQIHARIPAIPGTTLRQIPLILTSGPNRSRGDARIWLR